MSLSLKVKFIAALVLNVGVVIALTTWWNLSVHRRHMRHATEDKVRAVTEAIDRGIHVAMREGRSRDVQRILEDAGRDPDIDKILIFDSQGKILRASQPDLVGRILDRDRLARYLDQPDLMVATHHENGRLLQAIVKKIRNRPECHACHGTAAALNGILHVDMSFRKTQEQIAEMERTALWTMLLTAMVLAVGGGILMVRLVDRPVARLMQAMARVERGDLGARAESGRRDEMGRLAEGFNAMVERLDAAQREIAVYHQQRLARAEQLATLGELAASLAHEIKNPLAGISGAVQVMADDLPDLESRKEILQEILAQIRRLDKAVRDILAFARPGKPAVLPCNIHQILDRVILLLAENPAAKQVRVVRAYGPGIGQVEADEEQLRQVFLNLMLNALQAVPADGQVKLETRLRGGDGARPMVKTIEVAVTDTGPGIPPHLIEEIFKPFFTTKHRGTGLGLPVSRRIVEDHGGRLEVESPQGQGATFRVFLPVESSLHATGDRLP
jgi:signal transduction histidine kinase